MSSLVAKLEVVVRRHDEIQALLAALHHAGLAALTHTPAPMEFLERLLKRPSNERGFMLIPVGYPAADCQVPELRRKSLDELRIVR